MYIKNLTSTIFLKATQFCWWQYNFCVSSSPNELISESEKERDITTQWLGDNSIIVIQEKFQATIIDRKNQKNNPQKLTIDEKVINSSENVTLLAVEVDSKLSFDEHVSKICNKSAGQLNPFCRIGCSIGFEKRNRPAPLLKMSLFHRCFSNILLVKTSCLVYP